VSNFIVNLLKAYKDEGYEISVGLNPLNGSTNGHFAYLVNLSDVEKATGGSDIDYDEYKKFIISKNASDEKKNIHSFILNILTKLLSIIPATRNSQEEKFENQSYFFTGGGISYEELFFFEMLLNSFKPRNEFLIGIASGWSTIALGLISAEAKLWGMDNCTEGSDAFEGLQLTEKIAKNLKLNLSIYRGSSPEEIPIFLNGVGKIMDFAFIDGLHTNEQIFRDYIGLQPYMADTCIMTFHDVLCWNMIDGWKNIVRVAEKNNFQHRILRRTTSGMGILYRNIDQDTKECIDAFYQNPTFLCPT